MPLILILGGLAALGWATAIVLYVLGLCQAAARGDRAIVRRRMLGCHHRWLDETPEGRRLGTDKDYCVFCHKSRSELRQSQAAARGDRAFTLRGLSDSEMDLWNQTIRELYNRQAALEAANRRR